MTPNGNNRSVALRLAKFVRTARRSNGMTQVDLAELARVGRRFVSELENGKPSLRLEHVERVLRVLGRELTITKPNVIDDN